MRATPATRPPAGRRRSARTVGAALLVALWVVPTTAAGQEPVDVEEQPAYDPGAYASQPAAGLFVGSGAAPGAADGPIELNGIEDFDRVVNGPSPALRGALVHYFDATRAPARVLLSGSEDAGSLAAAIEDSGGDLEPALWVVPALGSLAGADYQEVAVALSGAARDNTGMALLDPPSQLMDPLEGADEADVEPLVGLAGILQDVLPAPEHAVLYSTPLLAPAVGSDEPERVPAAAVMAAEFTVADEEVGPWAAPAGAGYVLDVAGPLYEVDNESNAALDSAGIHAIRTMPGLGTVAWGSRTLGESDGAPNHVGTVRTLDRIRRAVGNGARELAGHPNDRGTWEEAIDGTNAYLEQLLDAGALMGRGAAEAYRVQVGVPGSMTDADVADGIMKVSVAVALEYPGEFHTTEVVVEMEETGGTG